MDNSYVLSYFIFITLCFFHGFVRGFTESAAKHADKWAYRRGMVVGQREGLQEGLRESKFMYRQLFGDNQDYDLEALTICTSNLTVASWRAQADPRFIEHMKRDMADNITALLIKDGFLKIEKVDVSDKSLAYPGGHDVYVGELSVLKRVPARTTIYNHGAAREYHPDINLCDDLIKINEAIDEGTLVTEGIVDTIKLKGGLNEEN